jgi:hypothetical protein
MNLLKLNQKKLLWLFQIALVAFVAFNTTRVQIVTQAIGSGYDSSYQYFYDNINKTNENYFNRDCERPYSLESRKKVRWVFKKMSDSLYKISYDTIGLYGFLLMYLFVHTLMVLISFISIKLAISKVLDNVSQSINVAKNSDSAFVLLLFLTLFLFHFNGKVVAFSTTIFEAAFVSLAIFASVSKKMFLFLSVATLAVLTRESGFLVILIWFVFNQKIDKNIGYFLTPFAVFLFANYDIFNCMMDIKFYIGSDNFTRGSSIGFNRVLFNSFLIIANYGILFSLMTFINLRLRRSESFNNNSVYLIFLIYLFVLIVATPLDYISIKFIAIPFVIFYVAIYREYYLINKKL